jgi:vacuolar protein-sorting-associated protein 4
MEGPSQEDANIIKSFLTPCSPGAEGATEMSWVDVQPDELLEPDLTINDFMRAVRNGRKSVNDEDVAKYTKWTGNYMMVSQGLKIRLLTDIPIYF